MKYSGETTAPIIVKKKVFQGYGLCEWNDKVLFVPYAVPDDKIIAEITENKKNYSFAEIKKIIEKSPARIKPACTVFGLCGGCEWLNIDYKFQLKYKQDILDSFFKDIAEKVFPIQACTNINHYRNKCFYPLSLRDKRPVFGMFAKNSHKVITHIDCKLQPRIFDEISEAFCEYIVNVKESVYNERSGIGNIRHIGFRVSEKSGDVIVIIVTAKRRIAFTKQLVRALKSAYPNITGVVQNINPHKGNVIMGQDNKLLDGNPFIIMELLGKKFKLNYDAFFQVNDETAVAMIEFVSEFISENDSVIDAFCGTGTIGLCIADKVGYVTGIENSAAAVKNARENARINNIENCQFVKGDVNKLLKDIIEKENPDTVIFDPPRKGLHKDTIIAAANAGINKIIYISCNPSTQLRDIKLFVENGYKVICRRGFDMFPHTWHIENIAVLEKI